jgi:hypothetical protein
MPPGRGVDAPRGYTQCPGGKEEAPLLRWLGVFCRFQVGLCGSTIGDEQMLKDGGRFTGIHTKDRGSCLGRPLAPPDLLVEMSDDVTEFVVASDV